MNTQTRESPVREFARLNLQIQRCRASGAPVPDDVQRRAQELEVWGHTNLTPQETARLMQLVAAEQQNLLREEGETLQTFAEVRNQAAMNLSQALRNAGSRQISRVAGLHREKPLTEDQMFEAVQKGKYTAPGRTHALDVAAEKVAAKTGRQVSRDDIKRNLGLLGDLMDDSVKMSKYLDANAGDDPVVRNKLERSIRTTYVQGMLEARRDDELAKRDPGAFKAYEVEMTPEERRRLDVADRVLAHAGPSAFVEEIHDRGEPGSIRAALADAIDSSVSPDDEVVEASRDVNEVEAIIRGEA
jgi:hypothetical protein